MDRQKKIVSMFDEIAKSYDLANRVLSFGSDILWRRRACQMAYDLYGKKEISQITDVACGTGDMLGFWEKMATKKKIVVKNYVGVDPSQGMLEVAKEKFPHFDYIQAYAQELPLPDESSEFLSITYGIRNVVEREVAIKEFARVLKPGGILVILEFTKKERFGVVDKATQWYMKRLLPRIGGVVSGNKEAYEYLPNSIDNFLTTKQLVQELEKGGFQIQKLRSFSFGISTLFIAQKSD